MFPENDQRVLLPSHACRFTGQRQGELPPAALLTDAQGALVAHAVWRHLHQDMYSENTHTHVCIYIHTYVYIYIYIKNIYITYIYIYTHTYIDIMYRNLKL